MTNPHPRFQGIWLPLVSPFQDGKLDEAVDRINRRYGQNAVAPAALMDGRLKPWHSRDAAPERYDTLLHGEGDRHLAIPRMTLTNPV